MEDFPFILSFYSCFWQHYTSNIVLVWPLRSKLIMIKMPNLDEYWISLEYVIGQSLSFCRSCLSYNKNENSNFLSKCSLYMQSNSSWITFTLLKKQNIHWSMYFCDVSPPEVIFICERCQMLSIVSYLNHLIFRIGDPLQLSLSVWHCICLYVCHNIRVYLLDQICFAGVQLFCGVFVKFLRESFSNTPYY